MTISPEQFRQMQERVAPKSADRRTSAAVEVESDLHDQIHRYCIERGYLPLHSRMDAASTIAVGWPDFTIFMPARRVVFIECKARNGKTTTAQLGKIAYVRKLGFTAEIVDNFEDFERIIKGCIKESDDLYMELIMAVSSKFENESRHQTALRYIKEREDGILKSAQVLTPKETI
jgi:hypothetical protein